MAHIAFLPIPYSGHLDPTLGVAAELRSRGHRVSYACTEEFVGRVTEVGAVPVPYGTTTHTPNGEVIPFADTTRYSTDDFVRLIRFALTEALTTLPQLARSFTDDPPDLVVYDPSFWAGRLLAERWNVPSVRSHATFVQTRERWSLGEYTDFDPHHPDMVRAYGAMTHLIARTGVDLLPEEFLFGGTGPSIAFLPRSFQFDGGSFGDEVHFAGPCPGPRAFLGSWSPPRDGTRVVLVSLGTSFNAQPDFFRACAAALAEQDRHVVITLGDGVDPESLGPLPPNVEAHRFAPHLEVLRHTDVFVNHGGMGTVMESLSLGVPVVAVPQMAEQSAAADRLVALGLGARVDRTDIDFSRLRATVEAVADDTKIRRRVQDMCREIIAAGGAAGAATALEDHLPSAAAAADGYAAEAV
ncbi:macrolide family glycosyltransferase [Nocardiopsis kunsanensis]|uniref:macrolide family glycosyltransferase n=1 Tax=Nocardiopsis kunsanensis TaxID=141693 RepID=UPI000347BD42|nr:macrolide family glycosyltransferase [Nocardiopsis kunsanensis]